MFLDSFFCIFAEQNSICAHSDTREGAGHSDRETGQGTAERPAAHEDGPAHRRPAPAAPAVPSAATREGERRLDRMPLRSIVSSMGTNFSFP